MPAILQWLAQFHWLSAAVATLAFSAIGAALYALAAQMQLGRPAHRFLFLTGMQLGSVAVFSYSLFSTPFSLPVVALFSATQVRWLQGGLAVIWLIVTAARLAGFGWQVNQLNKLVKHQSAIAPRWLRSLTREAAEQLGHAGAEVRLLAQAGSAAAWGLARPLVLLPVQWLTQLSETELRLVILHELVHLRRADVAVHLLMSFLSRLLWFSPLNQAMHQWMALERECAVDDAVMACTADPIAYSTTLLQCGRQPSPAWALAFARQPLLYRVQRMVQPQQPPRSWRPLLWVGQGVVALVLMISQCITLREWPGDQAFTTPALAQAAVILERSWADGGPEPASAPPAPVKTIAQQTFALPNQPAALDQAAPAEAPANGYHALPVAYDATQSEPVPVDSTEQKSFIQIDLAKTVKDSGLATQRLIIQVDKQVLKRAKL